MREPYSICLLNVFMKFTLSQIERYLLIATKCDLHLNDTFHIEAIITFMHTLLSLPHQKGF